MAADLLWNRQKRLFRLALVVLQTQLTVIKELSYNTLLLDRAESDIRFLVQIEADVGWSGCFVMITRKSHVLWLENLIAKITKVLEWISLMFVRTMYLISWLYWPKIGFKLHNIAPY